MDDILYNTPFYFQDMPIYTVWNVIKIETTSNYYVLRISLPERISIS